MPITCAFTCLAFFGVLLFVPAAPIALVCLILGRRREAAMVVSIPLGAISLSVSLTILVSVAAGLHNIAMSMRPRHLFRTTFDFRPPAPTTVLESYHSGFLDFDTTTLKIHAPRDVIEKIVAGRFIRTDREHFLAVYGHNRHNLPDRVQSWFLPSQDEPDSWYVWERFDGAYGHEEAVLCYDEQTQIAYFHWAGLD